MAPPALGEGKSNCSVVHSPFTPFKGGAAARKNQLNVESNRGRYYFIS